MVNNPAKGTKDTFERELKSNAIGDDFIDPGQYFLRKPDNNERLKLRSAKVGGSISHSQIFRPSGGPKLVKKSEFEHHHNGPPPRPEPVQAKNFLTRFTSDTFQKRIPYTEDLYENKEELIKSDYVNRRCQILTPNRPYTTIVRQHGTFYPTYQTYGTLKQFPNVSYCIFYDRLLRH